MAAAGAIDVVCPVCHMDLSVPINASGPVVRPHLASEKPTLTVQLEADGDYIDAHWRTHKGRADIPLAA